MLCNFTPGYGITLGSDKKFYMSGTNYDYNTSRYTLGIATIAGTVTAYDIASSDYGANGGLPLAPDHNV